MIAEQFVALQVRIVEGVFAEQDAGVATRYNEAPQGYYQGVLKPPVGDAFKPLHDTSVSAVPRETKHHHCGNFRIEVISYEDQHKQRSSLSIKMNKLRAVRLVRHVAHAER